MVKFPPKGYEQIQYPLPHYFEYAVNMQAEDETKNSFYATLLRSSEVLTAPESVEVNPANVAFAEDAGPLIHPNSIVPKLSIGFTANLTQNSIETDKLRGLYFEFMPVYCAFLNTLEAEDAKTAVQIEDILELTHNTDNKDVHPTASGVDLIGGPTPVSTVGATEVFGDYGLTTNTQVETVAFEKDLFFKAKSYYGNAGMLRKVTGRYRRVLITRDRPYQFISRNYTHPMVKRANPYMFCGILFHLPQSDDTDQVTESGDTTAIDHITLKLRCRYDEWNPLFDQSE